MARYFMHLVDGGDTLLDDEGVILSEAEVAGAALFAARDCMSHDIRTGCLKLGYRIDVHDQEGKLVHSLGFRDAVEIV
jgi:hypothetical protein